MRPSLVPTERSRVIRFASWFGVAALLLTFSACGSDAGQADHEADPAVVADAVDRAATDSGRTDSDSAGDPATADDGVVAERDLAAVQERLLSIGFRAASSFPLGNQIKNRSRTQNGVLEAALAVDRPDLVVRWVDDIKNWRRGSVYADLALYHAERSELEPVAGYLKLAEQFGVDTDQAWRTHHVRSKVAQVSVLMGEVEEALAIEANLVPSEAHGTILQRSKTYDREQAADYLARVEAVWAGGDFENLRSALTVCADIYGRFHGDAELAERAKAAVLEQGKRMPRDIFARAVIKLAEGAIENGENDVALGLLDAAQKTFDDTRFDIIEHTPVIAEIATARAKAGAVDAARAKLDATLATYRAGLELVHSIFRCETLRSLAVAYHQIGDEKKCLDLCREAIEESVVNPNSRPRAQDLAETCSSLARNRIDPGESLIERMEDICSRLGDPW